MQNSILVKSVGSGTKLISILALPPKVCVLVQGI